MFETVEHNWGMLFPHRFDTLEEAILYLQAEGGAIDAELNDLEEFVEGSVVTTRLVDIIVGEWIPTEEGRRRNIMAKAKAAARNVADDLLGDEKPKKDKKPAVKGKKPTAANGDARGRKSAFEDGQKIKVLKKDRKSREGTTDAKDWKLILKCDGKTVKDYKKARKAAGFETELGGFFTYMVRSKAIRVV